MPKKEHQPLPPPTGAYYRATKPIDKLRAGDLILLWTEEGQIHGQFGDEGFYYDEEEFAGHFIPAPEGRSERLKQIETILTEANAEKNVTPDVLQLPLSVEQGTNPEAALVTTKHRSSIIEAKKAALLAKKRVEVIKTELHGLLMEQQKALELASTKWEAQLNKLNYAISSINLYLGRDEEIVCIQEGEAAPVDEPISIRQTILFMDEETTLYTEEGGIDFKNLDDFDKWLCEPKHLQQILPETKGIIALRLRRGDKFYANEDIWTQIMLKLANGGTYILVRNGQRLWRIWNEIELPDHLFPTKSEFEQLFCSEWNQEQLRPGSRQYQKALSEANGLQKRYLQVVLLMQGLLDRTQIFKPLAVERVNLLDPDPDTKIVRLIRDAENILGAGRPSYSDWLRKLNAKLEVGKRIVFGGTRYMACQYESRKESYSRTRPKHSEWPEHLRIYTVKGTSTDHSFYFAYPRSGVKAHAAFHFSRSDPFILNYDDATEEDIQFYLSDRCNRHHYLASFPTLKAALSLKAAERETEKPFVDLLVREAAEKSKAEEAAVRKLLAEIIPWWKQKNQASRNLTRDEKAAFSQILREVSLRLDIQKNKAGEEAVSRIQQARPDWLVIGKDSGRTLVCLRTVPHIKGLVTREEWDSTGAHCVSTSEWFMPDSEHGRWHILAATPAWEEWPKHGRRGEFLSEPEYQELLAQTKDRIELLRKEDDIAHLAAITAGVKRIYLHGIFASNSWSSSSSNKEWACKELGWERSKAGVHIEEGRYRWRTLSSDLVLNPSGKSPNKPDAHEMEWDHVQTRLDELTPEMMALPFTAYGHRLLFFDDKALQESRKLLRIKTHKREQQDKRREQVRHFCEIVSTELTRRFWDHEKHKYLADGGVSELWEDHAKTVKHRAFDLDQTDLQSCIEFLIDKAAYNAIVGRPLATVWEMARERGWKPEHEEANKALPGNIILSEMKEE